MFRHWHKGRSYTHPTLKLNIKIIIRSYYQKQTDTINAKVLKLSFSEISHQSGTLKCLLSTILSTMWPIALTFNAYNTVWHEAPLHMPSTKNIRFSQAIPSAKTWLFPSICYCSKHTNWLFENVRLHLLAPFTGPHTHPFHSFVRKIQEDTYMRNHWLCLYTYHHSDMGHWNIHWNLQK